MQKKVQFYLFLFLLLSLVTALSHLFRAELELINIALIHLLPVVFVALRGNFSATGIVTLITIVLFNFLYIPPIYSFDVHDIYYVWSFFIFALVGYIITSQAKKIHSNQIREVLLSALSHDLKTPISSIQGNALLLLENSTIEDSQKEKLTEIKSSCEKINRLIANLLDSARLQSEFVELNLDWCDIEDTLGVALKEFSLTLTNKIKIHIDENLPLYWGDSTLMVRLFVNLIDNALKYTQDENQITVALLSSQEEITIAICNQSKHFNQEELASIFDKFYRLDNAADINGSGIGLSICKNIVELHQGKITAYNEDKKVCFKVSLPLLKQVAQIREEL